MPNRTTELLKHVAKLNDLGVETLVVSGRSSLDQLDLSPFGVKLQAVDALNHHEKWNLGDFLQLYNFMNGLAFGGRGMAMPHWVMVDLALLPSGIVMAGIKAGKLGAQLQSDRIDDRARGSIFALMAEAERLNYDGPLPVAAYCATPTVEPGRWIGWSLCSILPGLNLGHTVKKLALEAYRVRYLDGIVQYDNASLPIHTRFGALRLKMARLVVHPTPYSFMYETDLSLSASDWSQKPSFLLRPFDTTKQLEMQERIDAHERSYFILPPGAVRKGHETFIPVLEAPWAFGAVQPDM